jgi:hypothetical protein
VLEGPVLGDFVVILAFLTKNQLRLGVLEPIEPAYRVAEGAERSPTEGHQVHFSEHHLAGLLFKVKFGF